MEQVMSVFLGNQFHKILVLEAHVHLGKKNSETALLLIFDVCWVAFWQYTLLSSHYDIPVAFVDPCGMDQSITVSFTPGIQLDILEEMPNGCSVPQWVCVASLVNELAEGDQAYVVT